MLWAKSFFRGRYMLDMKFIRENPELVKRAIINKNEKTDLNSVLELDKKKRELQFKFDTMRAEQNTVSKQIPELKKAKKAFIEKYLPNIYHAKTDHIIIIIYLYKKYDIIYLLLILII